MRTTTSKFICFMALFIFASCKKDGPAGPQGPAGPAGANGTNYGGKGSLVGIISFYDTDGLEISVNTNAQVFIPNTSFSTTINAYGGYTLTNIPTGVYNVFVKCTGYSMANSVNVSVGTSTTYLREMSLTPIPQYGIWTLNASPSANGYNLTAPTPTSGANKAVEFYVSGSPTIDPFLKSTYKFSKFSSAPNSFGYGAITLYTSYLNSNGFTTGQPVYVKAVPVPAFYASSPPFNLDVNKFSYTDSVTGSYVNTAAGVGGAATASFVCP